jgi:hypothetical protein
MTTPSSKRWILAFDASCRRCRAMSDVVSRASDERLEVMPLAHPDVQTWRVEVFGVDAPWVPTLIGVRAAGEVPRCWTGAGMVVPMVRRLGLRRTLAVLVELGRLRNVDSGDRGGAAERRVLSRKGFLRLGAGVIMATGLLVAGRAPAFGQPGQRDIRKWIDANRQTLPRTYDELIAHPMAYRKAIYEELAPQARQAMWVTQLGRYRASHPRMTDDQQSALEAATAYLAGDFLSPTADAIVTQRLAESAIGAFGRREAGALFATLGPRSDTTGPAVVEDSCECNVDQDFCTLSWCQHTGYNGCAVQPSGCGWLYQQRCNGLCV